jgi:hypothetical protein
MSEFSVLGHFSIKQVARFTEKCLETRDEFDDDRDFDGASVPARVEAFKLAADVLRNPSEGGPDDYHDYAIIFARADYYTLASDVLLLGLGKYSGQVDLLAGFLAYAVKSSKAEHYALCEEKYTLLKTRRDIWNWRAYEFSIEYLEDKINRGAGDIETIKDECLSLAKKYQEEFPNDELGYLAEGRVHSTFKNEDAQEDTLRRVCEKDGVLIVRAGMSLARLCQSKKEPEQAVGFIERVIKDMPNINNYTISLSAGAWLMMIKAKIIQYLDAWHSAARPTGQQKDAEKLVVKEIVEDWVKAKKISNKNTPSYGEIEGMVRFVKGISGFEGDDVDL